MGCGCSKNRPKLNQVPKNPVITSRLNSQNFTLKVNNPPVKTQQVQIQSNVPIQRQVTVVTPNTVNPTESTENLSPAGLNAHQRRIEALRRTAIKNTFKK